MGWIESFTEQAKKEAQEAYVKQIQKEYAEEFEQELEA